jgi:hypothetical protein
MSEASWTGEISMKVGSKRSSLWAMPAAVSGMIPAPRDQKKSR